MGNIQTHTQHIKVTNKAKKLLAINQAIHAAHTQGTITVIKDNEAISLPDKNLHQNNLNFSNKKLICFDMDSTIIKAEIMNLMAKQLGIEAEMSNITQMTMLGKIDFKESFKQRVAMLKGLNTNILNKIINQLPAANGLEELTTTLKNNNVITAIITGNFKCFSSSMRDKYGFNYNFGTTPQILDGNLSGKIEGEIIDPQRKLLIMKQLCTKHKISPQLITAVGDGANDIPMMMHATTSIIYNATKARLPINYLLELLPNLHIR